MDGSGYFQLLVNRYDIKHPFSITMFEDKLYWSDWDTESIRSADKFTGYNVKTISSRMNYVMDIKIYHSRRQNTGM